MRRSRRRAMTPQQLERLEERMRPSRFIGYEHDSLALHLLQVGSLDLAESELRRAVWLNPFEPRFFRHLAWCLYRKAEYAEARDWASRALAVNPADGEGLRILSLIATKAPV